MAAPDPQNPLALVLASVSPRRQALVRQFFPDLPWQVLVPQVDEAALERQWTASPGPLASRLARAKIQALLDQERLPERAVILSADTLVVCDGTILGKPANRQEAKNHLHKLSGRAHQVYTGLALAVKTGQACHWFEALEHTSVRFARLSPAQVDWYVATGEADDKAGSYGIQGLGAALIEAIDGCYYTVMGLPVFRLLALLQEAAGTLSSPDLLHLLPWNRCGLPRGEDHDTSDHAGPAG